MQALNQSLDVRGQIGTAGGSVQPGYPVIIITQHTLLATLRKLGTWSSIQNRTVKSVTVMDTGLIGGTDCEWPHRELPIGKLFNLLKFNILSLFRSLESTETLCWELKSYKIHKPNEYKIIQVRLLPHVDLSAQDLNLLLHWGLAPPPSLSSKQCMCQRKS
jgi:hypothetical protein